MKNYIPTTIKSLGSINDDIRLHNNWENKTTMYPVNGSPVSFDEDELQDHIKDKWCLIDIIVHFQLETEDGIIADIVTE